MKKRNTFFGFLPVCFLLFLLAGGVSSCRTSGEIPSRSRFSHCKGVRRVHAFEFAHKDVPSAFDGCRIAFISDLHYKSLLRESGLQGVVRLLEQIRPDLLLMGGDYQEGCVYVVPLFDALSGLHVPLGIYGVLGNNDYERCHDDIVRAMESRGIHVLEHRVDTVCKGTDRILVAGVRNPFDLKRNGVSPTLPLHPEDFVILLSHNPEYAAQVSVANSDLVLAGHTHGGQVRLFGWSPAYRSPCGQRFLHGLNYTDEGIPVITTNGIGTSRMAIRLGAPSEIVVVTLRCAGKE